MYFAGKLVYLIVLPSNQLAIITLSDRYSWKDRCWKVVLDLVTVPIDRGGRRGHSDRRCPYCRYRSS